MTDIIEIIEIIIGVVQTILLLEIIGILISNKDDK